MPIYIKNDRIQFKNKDGNKSGRMVVLEESTSNRNIRIRETASQILEQIPKEYSTAITESDSALAALDNIIDLATGDSLKSHVFTGDEAIIYSDGCFFIGVAEGDNQSWFHDIFRFQDEYGMYYYGLDYSNSYEVNEDAILNFSALVDNQVAMCFDIIRISETTETGTRIRTLKSPVIVIKDSNYTSNTSFKSHLASIYESGKPLILGRGIKGDRPLEHAIYLSDDGHFYTDI